MLRKYLITLAVSASVLSASTASAATSPQKQSPSSPNSMADITTFGPAAPSTAKKKIAQAPGEKRTCYDGKGNVVECKGDASTAETGEGFESHMGPGGIVIASFFTAGLLVAISNFSGGNKTCASPPCF